MPTANGEETLGDAIERLTAEKARIRETLDRQLEVGRASKIEGIEVEEVSLPRVTERLEKIEAELEIYRARAYGTKRNPKKVTITEYRR